MVASGELSIVSAVSVVYAVLPGTRNFSWLAVPVAAAPPVPAVRAAPQNRPAYRTRPPVGMVTLAEEELVVPARPSASRKRHREVVVARRPWCPRGALVQALLVPQVISRLPVMASEPLVCCEKSLPNERTTAASAWSAGR